MFLVCASSEGLVVCPTHRLVKNTPGFDAPALLQALERDFTVTPGGRPEGGFGLFLPEGRFALAPKAPFAVPAAEALNTLILGPLLGITPALAAAGERLAYTRSEREAGDAVRSGQAQCAFTLGAALPEEIIRVASAGGRLPQKSTYFYPKPITGLVIHDFNS
jgi:uncharacterized protein (DUF1015 family)